MPPGRPSSREFRHKRPRRRPRWGRFYGAPHLSSSGLARDRDPVKLFHSFRATKTIPPDEAIFIAPQSAITYDQVVENSASRMHAQNAFKTGRRTLFITYASYSHSGVKGLVNKPSDRSVAVKALIEKAGGKLVALYNTTGSNDVVLVSELADGSDAVAIGMAVAATGALSRIETVRAWTPSEFKGIAEKAARVASAYTPPGS